MYATIINIDGINLTTGLFISPIDSLGLAKWFATNVYQFSQPNNFEEKEVNGLKRYELKDDLYEEQIIVQELTDDALEKIKDGFMQINTAINEIVTKKKNDKYVYIIDNAAICNDQTAFTNVTVCFSESDILKAAEKIGIKEIIEDAIKFDESERKWNLYTYKKVRIPEEGEE